jgi:hypothetical protein
MFYKAMTIFEHLTFTCDLDLGGSNQIIALCTSSHYGDYLCQVILKKFSSVKGM